VDHHGRAAGVGNLRLRPTVTANLSSVWLPTRRRSPLPASEQTTHHASEQAAGTSATISESVYVSGPAGSMPVLDAQLATAKAAVTAAIDLCIDLCPSPGPYPASSSQSNLKGQRSYPWVLQVGRSQPSDFSCRGRSNPDLKRPDPAASWPARSS
jgi:hypothetical protein